MVSSSRGLALLTATLAVVAVVAGGRPAAAQSPCGAILDDCLDDFTCYKARTTPGTPRFAGVASVTLVDQFENVTARVQREKHLCTPTDKEGEGTVDLATHLVTYSIKDQNPRHIKRTAIRMTNQLGDIRVNTIKPELLLVPTAKSLSSSPPPPNSSLHNVDHYKCYRVRVTPRTPKFASGTLVTAADQFEATRVLTLKKVRHLCTPVSKNGEMIKNEQAHLLCYVAKPGIGSPKHTRVSGAYVNNQFGPLRLDTTREGELCIPSSKSFSPSGAFLDAADDLLR